MFGSCRKFSAIVSVLKWNVFFSSNCHSAISSGQNIFQSYCADASLGFAFELKFNFIIVCTRNNICAVLVNISVIGIC